MDMRYFLNLVETVRAGKLTFEASQFEDPMDDEEAEESFDHLPSIKAIDALRPQLVAVAQKQYNAWDQDEEGYDEELGTGGICHLIADDMQSILSHAGFAVWTQTASDVQHVTCIVQASDGIYDIDIPYNIYERGSMFTWKKLPDVVFEPRDVSVYRISIDPSEIAQYVENYEDY